MNDTNDITDYSEFSREGLIDMLEKATERMNAAETRNKELEAALAGQHETVCAYCQQVFKSEDRDAIVEHIKTCDKRPEKAIFEAWKLAEKKYKHMIASLYDAGMEVLDTHNVDEDGTVWGDDTPVFVVPDDKKRDEAIAALTELLMKGPQEDEQIQTSQETE